MAGASQTFVLPPVSDPQGCAALHAFLGSARGHPVRLDGSEVRRFGERMAQVLLAACADWKTSGAELSISGASTALREGRALLGIEEKLPLEPAT